MLNISLYIGGVTTVGNRQLQDGLDLRSGSPPSMSPELLHRQEAIEQLFPQGGEEEKDDAIRA